MADEDINEDEHLTEETGEQRMLREAISALRIGDRKRARDLLTRLLKEDQKNATCWIWLSSAVETQKERIYCLQMALQVDPENAVAKRGLILLGVLPRDESIPPFPVNRPREWEEKLSILEAGNAKKQGWSNPLVRLLVLLGIAIVVVGLFISVPLVFPNSNSPLRYRSPTRRPTVTITFTPTQTPVFRTPTPTFPGPTPLWMFLQSTFTPTPLYVITQHPVIISSAFEAGLRFLAGKDYENAHILFQQALSIEPEAPDIHYYIGETHRAEGEFRKARDAYQLAINLDAGFAPAYLGRARANLGINPETDVLNDLNEALSRDPNYAEAYIERGTLLLEANPAAAKTDFETAIELTPDSALAYQYLADAQLALGENEEALASALHANQLDFTLLPVYQALARAYIATGQAGQAVGALQTYTLYHPEDGGAYVLLGTAYNSAEEYEAALEALNQAIDANQRDSEAYYQRGFAYLNLDKPNLAETDFNSAITYDANLFDAQLGLALVYDRQGKPGDAYMQIERNVLPKAHSTAARAQAYYWESIFLEEMNDLPGERASWYRLINLPAEAMPQEWRQQAYQHLNITPTFTPTLRPSRTPTGTPKP